jgi:hypothetical protein
MIRSIAASPVVVPVGTPGVAVACGGTVAVAGTFVAVAGATVTVARGVSPTTVAVDEGASSSPPQAISSTGTNNKTSNRFMYIPTEKRNLPLNTLPATGNCVVQPRAEVLILL